jgi:hypothetical protein
MFEKTFTNAMDALLKTRKQRSVQHGTIGQATTIQTQKGDVQDDNDDHLRLDLHGSQDVLLTMEDASAVCQVAVALHRHFHIYLTLVILSASTWLVLRRRSRAHAAQRQFRHLLHVVYGELKRQEQQHARTSMRTRMMTREDADHDEDTAEKDGNEDNGILSGGCVVNDLYEQCLDRFYPAERTSKEASRLWQRVIESVRCDSRIRERHVRRHGRQTLVWYISFIDLSIDLYRKTRHTHIYRDRSGLVYIQHERIKRRFFIV